MKKTITAAALALVLAAPAAAFSADNYDAPTSSGRTAGRPAGTMTRDNGANQDSDQETTSAMGNLTAVDQTIADLKEARRASLNGAAASKTRSRAMREIENALKDLQALQSRNNK